MSQQQFGPGVNTGVNTNTMSMLSQNLNAQQVLAQQQQQQTAALQQMQQLQQQQLQLQQQQAALAQQNSQTNQASPTQQPVPRPQQPPTQKQPNKECSTASLCKFGQETVQEIVTRTQEVFSMLKVLQLPNGTFFIHFFSHKLSVFS